MDPGLITKLAAEGGLILYCVVATLVAAALYRRVNHLTDKLIECGAQAALEGREMQAAMLTQAAATQAALTANTTAISALDRTVERRP